MFVLKSVRIEGTLLSMDVMMETLMGVMVVISSVMWRVGMSAWEETRQIRRFVLRYVEME